MMNKITWGNLGTGQHLFTGMSMELLSRGYSVRFRAPGRSMLPTIQEGEMITVSPVAPSDIHVGDIILYRWARGVIAHRVTEIERKGSDGFIALHLRGDASDSCDDPVEADQVLGRVVSLYRDGKRVDLIGRAAKMQQKLFVCASKLRKWICSAAHLMKCKMNRTSF